MVTITYTKATRQLRMKGHANYSDEGSDIVCAACSTLFCTLCQNLLDEEAMGHLAQEPKMEMSKGRGSVRCIPKTEAETRIDIIFRAIICGFHMLSQRYPEYVNLKYKSD
jgi:uncharacterized protein YsxB (DUF464 family)